MIALCSCRLDNRMNWCSRTKWSPYLGDNQMIWCSASKRSICFLVSRTIWCIDTLSSYLFMTVLHYMTTDFPQKILPKVVWTDNSEYCTYNACFRGADIRASFLRTSREADRSFLDRNTHIRLKTYKIFLADHGRECLHLWWRAPRIIFGHTQRCLQTRPRLWVQESG